MADNRREFAGIDDFKDVIAVLERKYAFKSISLTLSEEEWFILNQVSLMTGLTKMMIFRLAINQLLKEILTKRQKDKKVGKKFFSNKNHADNDFNKRKTCSCSTNMPSTMHNAISAYAKANGLKSYEAYSQIVDEFLEEAQQSEKPLNYRRCPKDALKKSIMLFAETLQGLKALKQRDHVSEYLLIYNAALQFIEKNNLLPERIDPTTN